MNDTKGNAVMVDPAVRDRLVRSANELLASESGQNPAANVVKKMSLVHVRDIPSATVLLSPTRPEAGEIILDRGDMGPRFTWLGDEWYRQQVAFRAGEARNLEKLRKIQASDMNLMRKAVHGWIKNGKVPETGL